VGAYAYCYVGCYTTPDRQGDGKGIEVYEMDPRSGAWTHVQTLETIGNPSWQTVGPDGRHLYSVHGGDGFTQVSAYSIDLASGKLTFLNAQECGSPNPVAISVFKEIPYAVVAGYNAGKVAALPVNPDGSLGPMSDLWTLEGEPGPHPTEQDHSRPHHIPIAPDGRSSSCRTRVSTGPTSSGWTRPTARSCRPSKARSSPRPARRPAPKK
jgi:6-phosphogluconolactonase